MIARSCLLLCCVALATAAQFNPRVSATTIALNESVRATFATSRPQVAGVDVGRALLTALESPTVARDWRLVGEPEVVQHEKAGDVTVSLVLRPRHSGEVALPQLPVTWLEGRRAVLLPTVTVHDHLVIGSETRDLPSELQAVAGYAWGAERTEVLAADPANQIVRETDRELVIKASNGLQLRLLDGRLAETLLFAQNLDLNAALGSFIQRWGSPSGREEGQLEWFLGWVHITATQVDENGTGILIRIVHEGISGEAMRKRVRSEVFNLLESGTAQQADPAPAPAPDDDQAEADDAGAGADDVKAEAGNGLRMEDIEAELQRRIER